MDNQFQSNVPFEPPKGRFGVKVIVTVLLLVVAGAIAFWYFVINKKTTINQISETQNTQVSKDLTQTPILTSTIQIQNCGSIIQSSEPPFLSSNDANSKNSALCMSQALVECLPAKVGVESSGKISEFVIEEKKTSACSVSFSDSSTKKTTCEMPLDLIKRHQALFGVGKEYKLEDFFMIESMTMVMNISGFKTTDLQSGQKINFNCIEK